MPTPTNPEEMMSLAIAEGQKARYSVSPRPWVGCVIVADGEIYKGFTQGKDGPHAEQDALAKFKKANPTKNTVLYVSLEPCAHKGQTEECTKAIISAGIPKVFVGILDPDPKVSGKGIQELKDAGIEVELGICEEKITQQLAPYLVNRTQARPYVVLKLAITLDGKIAAPDGSSKWITGEEARADAHRLRAESDAVVVGANTIKQDDPALTVRDFCPEGFHSKDIEITPPIRVVLGSAPKSAKAQPLLEISGTPAQVLKTLHKKDIMQVLIEGGAKTANAFHTAGLVDKYVFYMAPAIFGDDSALSMMDGSMLGPNPPDVSYESDVLADMSSLWRGKLDEVQILGEDLKIEVIGTKNSKQYRKAP